MPEDSLVVGVGGAGAGLATDWPLEVVAGDNGLLDTGAGGGSGGAEVLTMDTLAIVSTDWLAVRVSVVSNVILLVRVV